MSVSANRKNLAAAYDRKILALGAGLGILFSLVPPFSWILRPLLTLFHELGHTTAFWAFGYPAIPSFDFLHGGGVTMGLQRSDLVVVALHLILLGILARLWMNARSLKWPAIGLAVLYLIFAWSPGHHILIAFAGHLATLTLAAIFVHHACRGVIGERLLGEVERPLFMASGIYVYLTEAIFIWGLASSEVARQAYLHNARGINDLRPVSRGLGLSLEGTSRLYLLLCLAAPLLLAWFLRHRGQDPGRWIPQSPPKHRPIDTLPEIWDGEDEAP